MPYYPYYFVKKCLKWPKIVFFSLLISLVWSCKNQIYTFALPFQNFEPYFIPTFLTEGPWKPANALILFVEKKKILKLWYQVYPKYLDAVTPYHSKNLNNPFYYCFDVS